MVIESRELGHVSLWFQQFLKLTWPQRWKALCGLEVGSNFCSSMHFPVSFGVGILGGSCVSSLLQLNLVTAPVGLEFPAVTNAMLPSGQGCCAECNGTHGPLAGGRLSISQAFARGWRTVNSRLMFLQGQHTGSLSAWKKSSRVDCFQLTRSRFEKIKHIACIG